MNEPPFSWLQGLMAPATLDTRELIITTHQRAHELSSYREQLALELAILREQKSARTTAFLQGLRRNNPVVAIRTTRGQWWAGPRPKLMKAVAEHASFMLRRKHVASEVFRFPNNRPFPNFSLTAVSQTSGNTGRVRSVWRLFALALALSAAGCQQVEDEAPPRATDAILVKPQASVIDVPVNADLSQLAKLMDRAVPRKLWTIDQPRQTCVASQKVKILFVKIETPILKCRIIGVVSRGPLALSGAGRTIFVTMPLHAVVSALDIGGILKRETATADARVRAIVRLDVAPDWSPRGTVSIAYDWVDAPHIDFLGRRIEFTNKADAKLKGVITKLEQTLPLELQKLHFREQIAVAWKSGFTSVELNEARPPVWMRVTPQALIYGGYSVSGGTLSLNLGMKALTETFLGPRPADPQVVSLPNVAKPTHVPGRITFAIPVIADYRELEPVLARALTKRSRRPFDVPGIGPVDAKFGKVIIYGTTGGKIAVGLKFSAAARGGMPSSGTVWLTARPINAINSRRVSFTDLAVADITDSVRTSLLIKFANAPGLSDTIADALTQDFGKDYEDLLGKISRAIGSKKLGDMFIRARITVVRTGQLQAAGRGIYLPVWGMGTASILLKSANHRIIALKR